MSLFSDNNRDWVSLTETQIDLVKLTEFVNCPEAGAISSFSGITRNNFEGKEVISLQYEGYEEMAVNEMMKLCIQARSRWSDICKISVQHKLGDCPVGVTSVFIAVSSPHRKVSLEAVHFLIDELKATVPIWKKEIYSCEDGVAWKANAENRNKLFVSEDQFSEFLSKSSSS